MARQLIQVEGLILSGVPRGEASRLFLIFTREHGLLWAVAQSVRAGTSKLRGHLQVGRLVKMDLVRGHDKWRVIGVSESEPIPLAKEMVKLMIRLLPPEEANPNIYDDFIAGLRLLPITKDQLSLETLLVVRLLFNLGYLDPAPTFQTFVAEKELSSSLIEKFVPVKREAIKLINTFLEDSHL